MILEHLSLDWNIDYIGRVATLYKVKRFIIIYNNARNKVYTLL
jgi:predicted SPOUT superfamily RNA methylase MTH1